MLLYAHVFRAEPSLFIISNDQFIISRPRSWLIFFPLYLGISYSFYPFNGQPRPQRNFFLHSTHDPQVTSVPSSRTSLDIWCKYETSSNEQQQEKRLSVNPMAIRTINSTWERESGESTPGEHSAHKKHKFVRHVQGSNRYCRRLKGEPLTPMLLHRKWQGKQEKGQDIGHLSKYVNFVNLFSHT